MSPPPGRHRLTPANFSPIQEHVRQRDIFDDEVVDRGRGGWSPTHSPSHSRGEEGRSRSRSLSRDHVQRPRQQSRSSSPDHHPTSSSGKRLPTHSPSHARGRKRAKVASNQPQSSSPARGRPQAKVAQWANGLAPTGRAKAHDYEAEACQIIIQACHEYEARIYTLDAWPEQDTQIAWARDTWKIACEAAGGRYQLSDRILGIACTIHYTRFNITDI